MRRALLALFTLIVFCSFLPGAMAVSMHINASPVKTHIGDVITLTGSITGVKTIAVYLFVTGPDLNPQGATLENLNIPTGRGLFTTAPVNMADGSWQYIWDTSVILGNLRPGKYTVYAVSTPIDRLRYTTGEYASTEIEFLPADTPANDVPLPPILPVCAVFIVAGVFAIKRGRSGS